MIKDFFLVLICIFVINGCTQQQTTSQTFKSYDCTKDCSGHQAGYAWAKSKGIDDVDDCGGNSQSFIEGCYAYVEDNY